MVRRHDWSATPLGARATWPGLLRDTIGLVLAHAFPMLLLWGRGRILLYNDAAAALLGDDHPAALAVPYAAGALDLAEPAIARAAAGETVMVADTPIRAGDSATFTVCYSPVHGEDGQGGVLVTLIETNARAEAALREREADLARVQRIGRIGGLRVDVAGGLRSWRSPEYLRLHGLDGAATTEGHADWLARVHPDDRARAERTLFGALNGTVATYSSEYRIIRPNDGELRWIEARADIERDAAGRPVRLVGAHVDMTAQKRAQQALAESEERLRSAIEVGRLGLWDWNVRTGEIHWSDEHFRMEGYAVGEVEPSYDAWRAHIHPDDRPGAERALAEAMAERREYVREFRVIHPDGSVHWLSGRGRFFYGEDGAPTRMIGAMIETTERRKWEERQNILIAELQHRTRNLMGVVRAIADRTGDGCGTLADFRARFDHRLDALARVQGLLSRLGASERITFDALLENELAALDAATATVSLDGPKGVRLRSGVVQTLAMALHELATNAMKYGALAQPQAALAIRWRLVPAGADGVPWLEIDWRESGVRMPPSDAAPQGSGQGRTLIEEALPYQLNARTRFVLGDDGVRCTIAIPVSATTAPS